MKPGEEEVWTAIEYARQKRRFVDRRMVTRSLRLHASLIFAGTLLTGWLTSWALNVEGMASMPLRYAISFVAAYAVFLLLVRVWSAFMGEEHGSGGGTSTLDAGDVLDGADFAVDAGEGCAIVAVIAVVGLLLAGLFAILGGMPLLLEVAFEVVFAGVIVRRARKAEVIGDWLGAALAKTWLPALIAATVLVGVATFMQRQAPDARTIAEALRAIAAKP